MIEITTVHPSALKAGDRVINPREIHGTISGEASWNGFIYSDVPVYTRDHHCQKETIVVTRVEETKWYHLIYGVTETGRPVRHMAYDNIEKKGNA